MMFTKEILEMPEDERPMSLMDIPQEDFLIMYGDVDVDVTGVANLCKSCKHCGYCELFMVDYGYDDKGEPIVVNCDDYKSM